MTAFIIRRVASLLLVLWGAVTLLFFLFFLLPNDPAELIAGGANKNPDPQVVENVREKYGFNEPIIIGIVLSMLLAGLADTGLVLLQRALTPWARAGART